MKYPDTVDRCRDIFFVPGLLFAAWGADRDGVFPFEGKAGDVLSF